MENFNGVPRFGHSDDITNLIDGDRLDYALGVIFIPCFMISAYIVWVVLMSIFKCCKVRFVSGSNLKPGTSAFVIRSIFLFFNIAAAIALVLYMTKGASSILDVIASVRNVSTVSTRDFKKLRNYPMFFSFYILILHIKSLIHILLLSQYYYFTSHCLKQENKPSS